MNQPVGSGMWPAALAGSAAFWLANVVISVTPVAAEYRAGLSISYVPMLAQAVAGGLVLGLAVSHVLHRHFDRIPTRTPVAKSIVVSLFALGAVTVLVEVPGKFLTDTENPVRYLVIGAGFNLVRFLALGVGVGAFYRRSSAPGTARPQRSG